MCRPRTGVLVDRRGWIRGTITDLTYGVQSSSVVRRPTDRLAPGEDIGIEFSDFPGRVCFHFEGRVVDDRALTGRVRQSCGGAPPAVQAFEAQLTLVRDR